MGGQQSVSTVSDQTQRLISELHTTGEQLSSQYTYEFLDPDFCNRLALIYNDKLLQYRKQDLDNVSYSLGIVSDIPETKHRVCESIIKHYTDRLNLISMIRKTIDDVRHRLLALTTGPRCEGDPMTFDKDECQGTWIPFLVMPDETLSENHQWYSLLTEFQNFYMTHLRYLLNVLDNLRDYDHDINDERLKIMNRDVKTRLDDLMTKSDYYYRQILTTRTMTPEEVRLYNDEQTRKRQEQSARTVALRQSNSLPPAHAQTGGGSRRTRLSKIKSKIT